MAFLVKQFTSLLLLLIISRLILSTHAVRQHFNQFSRNTAAATTTAATTDPTDLKPDNYEEFSEKDTQPAFYANDVKPHGLGTSPPPTTTSFRQDTSPPSTTTSFRPLNYDPVMYTTSPKTQKNMYAQNNEDQTVAEKFKAYNPFSNSKYVDQYKENKKHNTESKKPEQYHYRDNSYQFNNQFQKQAEPSKTTKYDTFSGSSKFSQQYNQFEQRDRYDPYGTNNANQQYIEAAEEEKEKKKPTTVPENQFGYKYNPFQRVNDQTETKKESNKYTEQYPNEEDAELDELLDEQDNKQGGPSTTSYKFSNKNSAEDNTNNEQYNGWDTWQAYGQKQQKKDNKYGDSETYSKTSTNNEWPAYDQKKQQGKDNYNQYTMSDAELNAMLDEEDKQAEDEVEAESTPTQGMSDTRLPSNQPYYQTYDWKKHAKEYANAFSGNALSIAAQNNP